MSWMYLIVSKKLTNLENHRTDTKYENSLITKTFVFQFINKYVSCFYLVYKYMGTKPECMVFLNQGDNNWRSHCTGDGFKEISDTLQGIFIVNLIAKNLVEVGYSLYQNRQRLKQVVDSRTQVRARTHTRMNIPVRTHPRI